MLIELLLVGLVCAIALFMALLPWLERVLECSDDDYPPER